MGSSSSSTRHSDVSKAPLVTEIEMTGEFEEADTKAMTGVVPPCNTPTDNEMEISSDGEQSGEVVIEKVRVVDCVCVWRDFRMC